MATDTMLDCRANRQFTSLVDALCTTVFARKVTPVKFVKSILSS